VQRGFFDLAKGDAAPIAGEVLQRIAALYAIEDSRPSCRGAPGPQSAAGGGTVHLAQRPAQALAAEQPNGGGDPLRMNHRKGLEQFVDDGRIKVNNNTLERAILPICLSRKNSLFASGDDGGARWAAVASLVETCKLNGVDPQRYFTDLLIRLVNGWPNSRIDELMPWCWTKADDQPSSAAA
jgi:hypothetical protein